MIGLMQLSNLVRKQWVGSHRDMDNMAMETVKAMERGNKVMARDMGSMVMVNENSMHAFCKNC